MKKKIALTTAAVLGMGAVAPAAHVMAAPAENGWVMEYGIWYYYSNSQKVKGGWVRDSKGWCYLSPIDGAWLREGWAKDSKGWCYIRDGYWVDHATWAMDSEGWQYIGPDGYWVPSVPARNDNPIETAEAAVKKVEGSKLLTDYNNAKDAVDALNQELPEKAGLLQRLETVKPLCRRLEHTFDYKNIDDLIKDKNTTIKSLENTKEKLEISEDEIDDAIDTLEDSLDSFPGSFPSMPALTDEQKSSLDPETVLIYNTVNGIIMGLNQSAKSSKESLRSQLDTLKGQREDLKVTRKKLIVQTNMTEDQLVSAAEKLIAGYKNIELQEQKVDQSIDIAQRNLDMLKLYKDQGMVTDIDLKKAQLNLDMLKYSRNAMETQKANIIRQLNLMIGESYDETAEVIFDTSMVDSLNISGIDKDDDLDKAIDNSYNVKLQKYEIELCENAVDRADTDNEEDSAQLDLDNAELKYDDIVRSEELKFAQAYDTLMDKNDALKLQQTTLANEKTNLDMAYMKYSIGAISEKAWKDAQASYKIQEAATELAKLDLFTAYRAYQWMVNGLSN